MSYSRKLVGGVVGALALSLPFSAMAQDANPYRVTMIVAKTGVLATVIGPAGTGFEAYIDRVNQAGGIDGHKIDLEVLDEQSTPAIASGLFQQVMADPPIAVVFFGQSTSQTQSRQLLEMAGLPILTVTADDSFMYPKPTRTMFQVGPTAFQQAKALIKVAEAEAGSLAGKKVATASVQTTFSDALVANIETLGKEMGFEVVASERFPAGIPSFASQAAKIAREAPDAVLVMAGNADGPLVIGAIKDAGVTEAPIVGYSALSAGEIFEKANAENYYAFRASNVAANSAEITEAVKGSAYEVDLTSSWWGAGWIVGSVLTQALDACGDGCDGDKLIGSLETAGPFDVPGGLLFGPVAFSAENHGGMATVQGYAWREGKVVESGAPIDTAAP